MPSDLFHEGGEQKGPDRRARELHDTVCVSDGASKRQGFGTGAWTPMGTVAHCALSPFAKSTAFVDIAVVVSVAVIAENPTMYARHNNAKFWADES